MSVVNTSIIDVSTHLPMSRADLSIGGTMIVRLSGFLRFPQMWDNHKDQLQLCSRFTNTRLIMTSPYMYQPVSKFKKKLIFKLIIFSYQIKSIIRKSI